MNNRFFIVILTSGVFFEKAIKHNIYYPENIKKCEELPVIPIVAYLAEKPIAIDEGLLSYGMLFNWIKKYQDMG